MKNEVFKFKEFEIKHVKSSMKVGVDGVLLGLWVSDDRKKILDVGTGCGVISLILAQRNPKAQIQAIDIDESSIDESKENFLNSPWKERLQSVLKIFPEECLQSSETFDMIVSNPPFFENGLISPISSRGKARHSDRLSVFSLIEFGQNILEPNGLLAMIFPSEYEEKVIKMSLEKGWAVKRKCYVRDREERPEKRMMIELINSFSSSEIVAEEEHLTLFYNGLPTSEYQNLGKDFYLKF